MLQAAAHLLRSSAQPKPSCRASPAQLASELPTFLAAYADLPVATESPDLDPPPTYLFAAAALAVLVPTLHQLPVAASRLTFQPSSPRTSRLTSH